MSSLRHLIGCVSTSNRLPTNQDTEASTENDVFMGINESTGESLTVDDRDWNYTDLYAFTWYGVIYSMYLTYIWRVANITECGRLDSRKTRTDLCQVR